MLDDGWIAIPHCLEVHVGRVVIACYRPKPGRAAELDVLMATHVSTLRSQGLATDRVPIMMRASDGTVIEVFEWRSADAIASAHTNPVVQEMWRTYGEVCDYVPLASLPEASQMFAEFDGLEL